MRWIWVPAFLGALSCQLMRSRRSILHSLPVPLTLRMSSPPSLAPQYARNLTVYHVNPHPLGAIPINMVGLVLPPAAAPALGVWRFATSIERIGRACAGHRPTGLDEPASPPAPPIPPRARTCTDACARTHARTHTHTHTHTHQDTADAAGDLFFDMHNVFLGPLECPHGAASGHGCNNPEAIANDLVSLCRESPDHETPSL